jgi:hypothetical protein
MQSRSLTTMALTHTYLVSTRSQHWQRSAREQSGGVIREGEKVAEVMAMSDERQRCSRGVVSKVLSSARAAQLRALPTITYQV